MEFITSLTAVGYPFCVALAIIISVNFGKMIVQQNIKDLYDNHKKQKIYNDFHFKNQYYKRSYSQVLAAITPELKPFYQTHPTALFQALMHHQYGFSAAEVLLLQQAVDWYVPRLQQTQHLQHLENLFASIRSASQVQTISDDHQALSTEITSDLKDMLHLLVIALESEQPEIFFAKERQVIADLPPRQIDEIKEIEHRLLETRSRRASSVYSQEDACAQMTEAVISDENYILSQIEPSIERHQLWKEISDYHQKELRAEHPACDEDMIKDVIIMIELEKVSSLSFFNHVLNQLQRSLAHSYSPRLVVGYTYETALQKIDRIAQLEKYLQESFHKETGQVLDIFSVDMTLDNVMISEMMRDMAIKKNINHLHLIAYPEQRVLVHYLEKLSTGMTISARFLSRDPAEGSHPEHWLQVLRHVFRLDDPQCKQQWLKELHYDQCNHDLKPVVFSDQKSMSLSEVYELSIGGQSVLSSDNFSPKKRQP